MKLFAFWRAKSVCMLVLNPPYLFGPLSLTILWKTFDFLQGFPAYIVIYHLVMTNSSPWKDSLFLIGKPSISIRAIYTMAMLHNQRVYPLYHQSCNKKSSAQRPKDVWQSRAGAAIFPAWDGRFFLHLIERHYPGEGEGSSWLPSGNLT